MRDSEFSFVGSAAVAVVGTQGFNGTAGLFPRNTQVTGNWIHDGGVWSKNYLAGAVFLALQAETMVSRNVIYSTPRSCATFNDNFGGGDIFSENLIFNCNRESADTGAVYTYNRLPFLTTVRDGMTPSLISATRVIGPRNLFFVNYGSSNGIDNDDGSMFFNNTGNVHLFGSVKHSTFATGSHNKNNVNSLYLSNGLPLDYGNAYHERVTNNTLIQIAPPLIYKGNQYGGSCDASHPQSTAGHPVTTPTRAGNTYYTAGANWQVTCSGQKWNMSEAQAHGMELGSQVRPLPTAAADQAALFTKLARPMLGLPPKRGDGA